MIALPSNNRENEKVQRRAEDEKHHAVSAAVVLSQRRHPKDPSALKTPFNSISQSESGKDSIRSEIRHSP